MQDYSGGILYSESQYFRQLWLWILLLGIAALSIWSMVQQLIFGKDFGNNPAPDAVLIVIAIVFGFGFLVIFYKMNLTTQVRSDGIYYRFFPFHLSFHKIELGDISECEVRNYSALKDYGGWGIRYGRKGKAYNVSGNRGVQLTFLKGNKLLFGSQKPEGFSAAIKLALGKA